MQLSPLLGGNTKQIILSVRYPVNQYQALNDCGKAMTRKTLRISMFRNSGDKIKVAQLDFLR